MSTHEATLTLTLFAAMATLQFAGSHRAVHKGAGLELPPAFASDGVRLTFGAPLGVAEAIEGLAAAGALDDPEVAAFAERTLAQRSERH